MKSRITYIVLISVLISLGSCNRNEENKMNIIFLHHSTGLRIWGVETSFFTKVAYRVNKLYSLIGRNALVPTLIKEYNKENDTNYKITKKVFPKTRSYGWRNFPYDYYNIWVKNAGPDKYSKEPTLEILTEKYDVIIFKHCFPVSNVNPDKDTADINSSYKSVANYKLQYEALKKKMHEFPDNKFILFTGAALVEAHTNEENALRAQEFFNWVREEWDEPGDNIFLWDLRSLETEGGLYIKNSNATSPTDAHPNPEFSKKAGRLLVNRIIDVIETNGSETSLNGERL